MQSVTGAIKTNGQYECDEIAIPVYGMGCEPTNEGIPYETDCTDDIVDYIYLPIYCDDGLTGDDCTDYGINCPGDPTPDPGGSGGGTPAASTMPIDKLIRTSSLTGAQKASLQAILDKITNNCLGKALYDYMVNNNKSFDWVVSPNATDPASYNPNTGVLTVKDPSTVDLIALQEELLHAYQNFTIPGGSYQYHNVGSSNIEFETKLLKDINGYVNGSGAGFQSTVQFDPTYTNWLDQITSGGTKFPSSYADIQSQYFYYLTEWQNQQTSAQNSYSSDVIAPNLTPTSMFNLINSSSCAQ